MATFDTSNINPIKGHQWLQRVHVSVNQTLKVMNNVWKCKYEYEKVYEQGDVILPISWVWNPGFDCKRFLARPAMYWNPFQALKQPLCMKTVFSFFYEKCKFVSLFYAQLLVFFALGFDCAYMCEWIRLEKQAHDPLFNDLEYLISYDLFQISLPWKLAYLEDLVSWEGTRNLELIIEEYAAQKDSKTFV